MFNTNELTVLEGIIARLGFMSKYHVIPVWGKSKVVTLLRYLSKVSYFQQVYVGWPLPSPVESPYDLFLWIWRVILETELIWIYHVLLNLGNLGMLLRGVRVLYLSVVYHISQSSGLWSALQYCFTNSKNNTNCHYHRIILFT